ncbi:MAG: peptidogalycan biosysnthesis protein, partial [Proteobacteria bacterium]|nr:peptidogalycan biosysnthesis protein [Pseudomonadota bacterium]
MSWQVKAVQGIEAIGAVAWNQFAEKEGVPRDPFLSYAFLSALEESGSVSNEVGWMPYHLLLENEDQSPLGVMPLYVKGHSQGEYIFDYSWADALERAGGRYYPKLLSAIPFTPVTGRRILAETSEQEQALVMGAAQMAEELNISSVHVNFLDEHAWRRRGDEGWLLRTHKQYHWQNQDYGSFDDFLSCLSSKKRKNIKRERRLALAAGITIECLTGSEILES